ncbi:collagen-binding domain-containing protein [Microbacterium sp. NPDC058062]|uniref:collagen-binding domain-containing protein n=1 Tax=Microbacterium sp. NPDC058062 TaxID=3346320 RepID=UPI0036DAE30C
MSGNRNKLATVAAAAALIAGGLVGASALPAVATETGVACYANPMGAATPIGSASGYSIFVTGDAILANSELEGTLAVGGDATFGDPRGFAAGQYPLLQGGVGGSADYAVPTIDGAPNRVLLNRFSPNLDTVKVAQVKRIPEGSVSAGAKIVTPTAGYAFGPQFGGTGTTYLPVGGGNMSPQIESHVQPWNGGAGAESFATELDAFDDYFAADEGAALLAQEGIWRSPQVIPGGETRIVLDPAGPNRVTLGQIDGAAKFRLEGYSATSPLVVKVEPTDLIDGVLTVPSELNAGKNAPGNAALGYVLWDLSSIAGDVEIVSFNEPVRGAIYAPVAHVIFPAESAGGREFEGQLVAASFTALNGGKELHTNLFLGMLPCVEGTQPGVPGTEEPGTEEPGTEEPGTDKPGTDEPGTDEPGTDEPGTDEPGTDQPGTEQPRTEEPDAAQPAVETPAALAVTGATAPWAFGGAAAVLAIAGGVLLWLARRRRAA